MKEVDSKKMCWSCKGSIPVEAMQCLYCGADVSKKILQEKGEQTPLFSEKTLEDSLTSLYSPPYPEKNNTPSLHGEPIFSNEEGRAPFPSMDSEENAFAKEEGEEGGYYRPFWSALFLSVGAQLFVLGLLLFFFSEGGTLRLEWKASNWWVYCSVALPFIVIGFKKASRLIRRV